ncbi:MAG: PEGA domain-containing protein [Planctomycetes bacterium]|nr:PEGA domain-containing protein [Planctomycetota bacterium]
MATKQSGRAQSGQRTIGGSFDIAGANRALDLLRRESLYGSLTITDGLQDLCAFFTRGGLRVLASGRPLPTIRSRLLASGALSESDVASIDAALEEAKESQAGKLVDERELLVAQGLKPNELDLVAGELIEEILLGCMLWEGADFELRTGEPDQEVMSRRDLESLTLSLGVDKLLERFKGKLRLVKDVRQSVPSARAIVQPTASGREAAQSGRPPVKGPDARALAVLLREIVNQPGSSVRHLALRGLTGEVQVAQKLKVLANAKLIKLTRARADQRAELERLREMEESLDEALNQLLRRVRVARTAADQGEDQRAARHFARAGGLMLASGRGEDAAKTFGEALGHAQDDLEAREGLVQSLWAVGREDDAAQESEELGKRYLDLNLPGRARRVLERAIGFKEETSTLQLLVKSLVKLDRTGAAADAGERLINRLRREGKDDEARELADELMRIGDDASRQKLARAAGVDRVKVAVMVAFALAFGLAYSYASGMNAARDEYRAASLQMRTELNSAKSLEKFESAVQTSITRLEGFESHEEGIGEHATEVKGRLLAVQQDSHLARELSKLLPWQKYHNLDELSTRVDEYAAQIHSPALGGPLRRLREQLKEFLASFERRCVELRQHTRTKPLGPDLVALFQLGKSTRDEFRAYPRRLTQAYVPVLIETTPPGAKIVVDGAPYETRTPVHVNLGLRGPLPIELQLEGYKPVKVELLLDAIGEPIVRQVLIPVAKASPRGKVRVHLKKAITRKGRLSGRYSQLSLGKDSRYFAWIELDAAHQAYVYPLHEIRSDAVYLVGVRVKLWRKVKGRWTAGALKTLKTSRIRRPTRALGRVLYVEPLSKTPRLDHEDLRRRVSEYIADRILEEQ